MVSVGLPERAIYSYINKTAQGGAGQELTLSCINSPHNVTLSGVEAQVDSLIALLKQDDIFARKLPVNVAYHSPQMNEIADEYLTQIGALARGESPKESIIFISSISGQVIAADLLCQANYWVQNLLSPVRFQDALEKACSQPSQGLQKKLDGSHRDLIVTDDILEIGPHSALRGPVREILLNIARGLKITYCPIIIRKRSALKSFLEAVGLLHCRGHIVDLANANSTSSISSAPPAAVLGLPEYPFDHSKTYWEESAISKGHRFRQFPRIKILGTRVPDWNPLQAKWRNVLQVADIPWVVHHKARKLTLYIL